MCGGPIEGFRGEHIIHDMSLSGVQPVTQCGYSRDERVRSETQMPVHLAESPLTCVAVGSGRSLEEFDVIHRAARSRARRNGLLR